MFPTQVDPDVLDDFRQFVRGAYPGGRFIDDRWDEQQWVMLVHDGDADTLGYLFRRGLAIFPSFPWTVMPDDNGYDEPQDAIVHIVPELIADTFSWERDEGVELRVFAGGSDSLQLRWDTYPSDEQIITALARTFCVDECDGLLDADDVDPQVVAALTTLVEAAGVEALANLDEVLVYQDDTDDEVGSLTAQLTRWAAATQAARS